MIPYRIAMPWTFLRKCCIELLSESKCVPDIFLASDDITPPEVEEETSALRKFEKQIRDERQKLTEAAIKLGEDRTQLMVCVERQ